jgi:hypothetical protein
MTKRFVTITILISVCFMIAPFCVPNAICGSSKKTTPAQIWTGEMTGMFVGTMKLKVWQDENKKGEMIIQSKVKVKLESTRGHGSGYAQGTINGKIKDGLLKAMFNGTAHVAQGSRPFRGKMIGTLSDSQGLGTYDLNTSVGQYTGEWTMEKQENTTE